MSFYKRPPTPIPKIENELCRVLPLCIADNFDLFQIMAVPRGLPKNWNGYIVKFRKDLACIEERLLL